MESQEKPIVFIDCETTGTEVATDRVVEVALLKIINNHITDTFQTYINPGKMMHPEAAAVTGLTDEFLKDFSPFSTHAEAILSFIGNADIAGHNIMRFDIPIMVEEFLRLGIKFPLRTTMFLDTFQNQSFLYPRDLAACVEFYTGQKVDESKLHGATADNVLALKLYQEQMKKHGDKLGSVEDQHKLATQNKKIVDYAGKLTLKDGFIIFNFGKHEGQRVTSEPKYVDWILNSPTFTINTKKCIEYAMAHNDVYPL
jgi:DNA polymerase III subunit epsilon